MSVLIPDEVTATSPIGGKARALWRLASAELPIPAWCVLPSGAEFHSATFRATGPGPFAVRSSATEEDGAAHSFAGQFSSFLNVELADVPEKVAAVIASAQAEHIRTYCAEKNLPLPAAPAVLIQQMVDARSAGVAFSADPVTGARQLAVVAAVDGLGEALVSGQKDADTWSVDPHGTLVSEKLAGASACLSLEEIRAVAALARRCEAHFGAPQDIEWAIDRTGALFLLQSRPVTTLGTTPDPHDELRVWDNSNIAESYGGVTLPLTFSFARRAYEHVYREFCRLMSVPAGRIRRSDAVFPLMLGHHRGRVYYNLVSWYRVLALLPGFNLNRAFMEQMMGVREPLPEEIVARIVAENRIGRVADTFSLVRTVLGLLWRQFTLPQQIGAFMRRLNDALKQPAIPLAQQRGDELVAHYRELESRLLTRWDAPLVNDFFAMIFYGVLRKKCVEWLGDTAGSLQNDLLRDDGAIISAEPARRIREMASLTPPDLAATLVSGEISTSAKLATLRRQPKLASLFDDYLARFGDRCLEELKLESPTVDDDPASLLTSIGALALRPAGEMRDAPPVSRPAPALGGLRGAVFRWVLAQTKLRVRHRENLRFERTRLFGRVRAIFRELGRRLAADGRLDAADDVFFLELAEVLGVFEGTVPAETLRGLVATRRAAFAAFEAEDPPPDRFTTRGPAHRHRTFASTAGAAPQTEGDSRQGLGACPGAVRGKARVVLDPRGARLEPGEILVARQTDPGWVVLFPAAAGLLVERGSLLSHSAIVSRELGLPCVVSLPGLTSWLQTGDLVEMDGQSGHVRKLSPPATTP